MIICIAASMFGGRAHAGPPAYAFTRIADADGPFNVIDQLPSINASGVVAFQISFDAGGEAIYMGAGQSSTLIAGAAGFSDHFNGPSINDAGLVAFRAITSSGDDGIFIGSGGAVSTIIDDNSMLAAFQSPWLNTAGAVAFRATIDGGGAGIFRDSLAGPLTPIAQTGATYSDFGFGPAINANGHVAFVGLFNPPGSNSAAQIHNGQSIQTVADGSGAINAIQTGLVAINDAGLIVFQALMDNDDTILYVGAAGGRLTPRVSLAGPYSFFYAGVAINDSGTIAFRADLDAGGQGIFTGPDPLNDAVIRLGDELEGSAVTNLTMSRQGLNDAGQIAFRATLANGRRGIWRADPQPSCPADLNGDNQVNVSDLLQVINAWGAPGPGHPADINHDGAVNVSDLLQVINGWGMCG